MKQKLYCYSFYEFKRLVENKDPFIMDDNTVIISIAGENESTEHLFEESDRVLNVDFDDIDPHALGLEDGTLTWTHPKQGYTVTFISPEMADKIVRFIDKNNNKNIAVHCAAGASRSQGIVRYINDTYYDHEWETRESNPCLCPNMYVVMMLKRKYREIFQ